MTCNINDVSFYTKHQTVCCIQGGQYYHISDRTRGWVEPNRVISFSLSSALAVPVALEN